MKYRVVHIKREPEDQKGERFSAAIERAMNDADEAGYVVHSLVPVENSGFTVGVIIAMQAGKI